MGVASHAHTYSFKPGRVVEWFFDDINLPDSTSDEAGSHGFIKFRIRPVQPLLAGTLLENIANIFFDFNPPVITEPSLLVAEFSTGVVEGGNDAILRVHPSPASTEIQVEVPWPATVRLNDVSGRIVAGPILVSGRERIPLKGLAKGSYLLNAIGFHGQRATRRVSVE
jgi:hypothetical protein